jgi:universal stress protein A
MQIAPLGIPGAYIGTELAAKIGMSATPDTLTILVPVDFSEPSSRAMAWAFDYAQRVQCALHLLHVLEQRIHLSDFAGRNLEDVRAELEQVEESARRELEVMAPHPEQRESIGQITRHMASGNPAAEIVAIADSIGADMIVMGTHGRSGLRRALIGSVAERVVRAAPCTVVCVKPITSQTGQES